MLLELSFGYVSLLRQMGKLGGAIDAGKFQLKSKNQYSLLENRHFV